jgi:hypothetical protein
MRPKKHETTGSGDLFRARLEQIINMRHELVQLASRVDWDWIDREVASEIDRQRKLEAPTRVALSAKHLLIRAGACVARFLFRRFE